MGRGLRMVRTLGEEFVFGEQRLRYHSGRRIGLSHPGFKDSLLLASCSADQPFRPAILGALQGTNAQHSAWHLVGAY